MKRALGIGFVAYLISFGVGIAAGLLLGVDFSAEAEAPPELWYVGLAASVLIMALCTWWYFSGKGLRASLSHGLLFGIVSVLVGFACDAAIMLPTFFLTDATVDPIAYYSDPLFWMTLFVVVVTGALVGWILQD